MFLRLHDQQGFSEFYKAYFSNMETDEKRGRISFMGSEALNRSMSLQRSLTQIGKDFTVEKQNF